MNSLPPEDLGRITDYVVGELDPVTLAATELWIAADPRRTAQVDFLRRAHTAVQNVNAASPLDATEMEHRLRRILADPSRQPYAAHSPEKLPQHKRSVRGPLPMARRFGVGSVRQGLRGSVAGMTAVVILGVVATHSTITGRFTRPSALPSRVYATGIGQTAQVTLADGSHVTIAPQSRLTIGRGFGRTTRTVLLTGEAYFDVSHSAGTPFLIQTGSISTRVLGTAFDIRYYPTDTAVRIAVLSGRVVASGAHATAHLTAGLIGHVTDSTATTMNGDVSATADWRAGRLTFDGTSVATVLASVGRWYGYEFIVTDSTLARRKVMATFRINEPEKTFAAIEYLLNVTMTFDRTKVIVRSRQPRGADPARRDTALLYSTPSEVGK